MLWKMSLLKAVEQTPRTDTWKLSKQLSPSQISINRYLYNVGLVTRRSQEVSHKLANDQAQRNVTICKQLLENP